MVTVPVQQPEVTELHGCDKYRPIIARYDWDHNIAMAIMEAESTCNTNAIGDTWVIGGVYAPSCGLFQIRTLANRPSCEELQDPATNIAWAYRLFIGRGRTWQDWSVYNNGKYQRYLQ